MGVLRRLRARSHGRDEQGFGLLELVVASTVMMTALTSLAYVATNAFGQIGMTRERQAANALLDEAMEQLRALPYDTIWLGMRTSDLAGDARIIGAGTTASPYRLASNNERLVHVSNNQTVAPLVPNSSSRTIDGTVYTVRVYLSYFEDDPASGGITATAYVDWYSGLQHPADAFVRTATIIFSPSAAAIGAGAPTGGGTGGGGGGGGGSPAPVCLIPAACAFAGPTLPYFSSMAGVKGGQTSIMTGTTVGATIASPVVANALQIAQISTVQGWASTESATLPSAPPPWGPISGSSQAVNDPANPNATPYSTQQGTTAPPASSPTSPFGPSAVTVSIAAASTYRTDSTTAAGGTNVCNNLAGTTAITDGNACNRTTGTAGMTTANVSLAWLSMGAGLTGMDVFELGATTATAHADRDLVSSGPSNCAGTSSTGCIHTTATRSISSVKVGSLPPALKPAGFGYLVELTGYSDTVTAEAGINAAAPSRTSTGTLRVWNGLGYTEVPWNPTGGSLAVGGVNVTTGILNIQITADLKIGSGSSLSTADTCMAGLACRKHAEATSTSPLRGTVSYDIRTFGVSVLSFTVNIDLGDITTVADYQDPP